MRSCITSLSVVEGRAVTTIEGLSPDGNHPLQKAWVAEQVPQCGYCQSGQIMQAAALLTRNKAPTREQIDRAHGRQHLPLRHLPAHHQRNPARGAGGLAMNTPINRRDFFGTTATGLTLALTLATDPLALVGEALAAAPLSPSVWVTIAADGIITIVSPASELGQGTGTTLPADSRRRAGCRLVQGQADHAAGMG